MRIQKWQSYDYKENTLIKSFKTIKKIGEKLKIQGKLLDKSCYKYKEIYINKNISSRNKIKRCIYIYCIFIIAYENNIKLNIIEILKDNNLSINNFNNCLNKLEENNFYLHNDMEKYLLLTKEHYNINIDIFFLIEKYNFYIKKLNNNKIKINKNSLLIYTFYNIISPKNVNNFIKIFQISRMTLQKIINKII